MRSAGPIHRRHRSRRAVLSACLGTLAILAAATQAAAAPGTGPGAPIDFGRQIRPLLSDRCFMCHGPGDKSQKGGLRLDTESEVMRPRKDGHLIVKRGAPAESELMRRLTTADADERMPPADSHLTLSPAEIALLRRWIEEGAPFGAGHWAFTPMSRAQAPPVRDLPAAWRANPIDAFVGARLEAAGVRPSPEAPRDVLIRRLALDLTGLPPSPAETDAFVRDRSEDAYERLVDRLLASPHYGERQAAAWLDLARFADTYGYQADLDRDMSPWRDWVIRAFNSNLPYDQFLTWQLAGDLLPSPTRDQLIATAFGRLHRQTNEGGSIEEEFRAEYVADRVHTVGTAMVGLTFECSRCHDHKYDPITQRDYYSLFAFFNNLDEAGLYPYFTRATPGPALLLWPDGQEARHQQLLAEIAATEAALARLERASAAGTASSAPGATSSAKDATLTDDVAPVVPPRPTARATFDAVANARTAVEGSTPCKLIDEPQSVAGRPGAGRALRFSGDNSVTCEGAGAFTRAQPFSLSLWLRPTTPQKRAVVLHRSRSWTDAGSRGYQLVLEDGRPFFGLIHFWPSNAVAVRARQALPLARWSQVTLTYDGSSRADGLRVYIDGAPAPIDVVRDQLTRDIVHRKEWGDSEVGQVHLALAGRFRDSGFKQGEIDDLNVFDVELLPAEVRALYAGATIAPTAANASRPSAAERALVELRRRGADHARLTARLAQLRADAGALIDGVPELMVMREMPTPRPAFVLKRGAYDAPGAAVTATPPTWLFPFAAELPRNRLGLARWLTDPRHPLTARVAVNRAWQVHFGRGLVGTPEDFGAQGELPTHPELLDDLARRFVASGWDLKALHKLIATSATYRQASRPRADLAQSDPSNRLLGRGPRHRLEAEQIRDRVLSASGLLERRLYGPSVKPYQPAGLWEESGTGKSYQQDHGEALYRRSLYTFWRRTSPPPSMTVFDAPTREVCVARRERTATPLQALALLNDPQVIEAGRVLAEHLVRESREPGRRVVEAMRAVLGRTPDGRERAILTRLLREQRSAFAREPSAAAKLLAIGERKADPALPAVEVAATAILIGALFNHDEFVMKR